MAPVDRRSRATSAAAARYRNTLDHARSAESSLRASRSAWRLPFWDMSASSSSLSRSRRAASVSGDATHCLLYQYANVFAHPRVIAVNAADPVNLAEAVKLRAKP